MKPELRAVSSELPEPPYPADTKANGYRPEFDIRRIKASRTWRLAGADSRNALLRLWLECWENIPVGSWPDDAEVIAISIDVSVDWFEGHRKRLMSGWVMHSDGNFYHPYITEMVFEMLSKRRSSAERKARSRAKNKENVTGMSRVTSCESHGSHAQEQEQEQEQDKEKEKYLKQEGCKQPLSRKRDWASVERVFDRLNELTKSNFRAKNGKGGWTAHAKLAMSRIEESSSEESMRVVEAMVSRWQGTDKAEYLRPATLFAAKNYENYLGQIGQQFERKNGTAHRPRELSPYEQRRQAADEWKRKAMARINGEERDVDGERLI